MFKLLRFFLSKYDRDLVKAEKLRRSYEAFLWKEFKDTLRWQTLSKWGGLTNVHIFRSSGDFGKLFEAVTTDGYYDETKPFVKFLADKGWTINEKMSNLSDKYEHLLFKGNF